MSWSHETLQLGDCFKAAGDLVLSSVTDHVPEVSDLDALVLVHGIVSGQGPLEGLRYTHAWVEGVTAEGLPMVADFANGQRLIIPAALYYHIGQIRSDECERYAPTTACERMLDFEHYGPWDGAPASHTDPDLDELAGSASAA